MILYILGRSIKIKITDNNNSMIDFFSFHGNYTDNLTIITVGKIIKMEWHLIIDNRM